MRIVCAALMLVAAAGCGFAQEATVDIPTEPDRGLWQDLKPDMPAGAVARVNDEFPLSDQANAGQWSRYEPMWDEFNDNRLDPAKWIDYNPGWKGRQPGYFWKGNVLVADDNLQLTMRQYEPPDMPKNEGFHTWSSAAVKSTDKVLYGYFEMRARPMRSNGSSAFWFYADGDGWWTEIDVFEISGGAAEHKRRVYMTQHVMKTPAEDRHWSVGGVWEAPFDLADDYHVYGLQWDEKEIKYYFDGALLRTGPNTHWRQPLHLNFDSETMPDWFGLPDNKDLPSTFSIDYMRSWQKAAP
jgi:beta-glucanase (GH16 family)